MAGAPHPVPTTSDQWPAPDVRQGLTAAEVERRRAIVGPNRLPQVPPPTYLELALRQFKNSIVILLLIAAALSLVIGESHDAIAILAALVLNALVGFFMDVRAEQSMAALREMTAPMATVRRDGHLATIPAEQLVPGDVVLLDAGDRIPADGWMAEGDCTVDESLLTGESVPVTKQATASPGDRPASENTLWGGTVLRVGSATAVVTATGDRSAVGRIGKMLVETTPPSSPLALRLETLGRYLALLITVAVAVIVLIGLWQGRPFWPLMRTAVTLGVAAMPEGLPAVATLVLAVGARRLARRGALLRRLDALEALGAITTLCLDKTGTLTANAMTVQALATADQRVTVTGQGWQPDGEVQLDGQPLSGDAPAPLQALLDTLMACNDATWQQDAEGWSMHGDPTEGALLVAGAKAGVPDPRPTFDRLQTLPAGHDHPWMVVVARHPAGRMIYAKGAPEHVLARCRWVKTAAGDVPLDDTERDRWHAENIRLASQGLRVMGAARRPLPDDAGPEAYEADWIWLGLVGMADPPRPDAAAALAEAHRAGIRTVMITGDQAVTAEAIARSLSLAGDREPVVVTGDGMAPGADVYARTMPAGKLSLVQALQAQGEVVAMTGDGVNDAPALRAAQVGIAMGNGVDVAKEAAALVLTDQRLSTIVNGIRQGRSVFINLQKGLDYLLTCSMTAMLTVLLTTAAGFPLPLLPLQILYLNLLTHTFPALGIALEPAEPEVMRRGPMSVRAKLLPPARLGSILWHGLIIAIITLAIGAWGLAETGEAHGRTLVFATLASALLLHALADRSARPFGGWRWGNNPSLFGFLGMTLILQLLAMYLPPLRDLLGLTSLSAADWWNVAGGALLTAIAIEATKWALPPDRPETDTSPHREGRFPS